MKLLRNPIVARFLILFGLVVALLMIDFVSYRVDMPVIFTERDGMGTIQVGTTTLNLGKIGTVSSLSLPGHDPVVQETQIDGTDSLNNFTLDANYFHQISGSPYYRFQAWMRDFAGTSRWHNLRIWAGDQFLGEVDSVPDDAYATLASSPDLRIALTWRRPETPVALNMALSDGTSLIISLDRNARSISASRVLPGTSQLIPVAHTFFPQDPAPYLAEVIDFLARLGLWAVLVLIIVTYGEVQLALLLCVWPHLAGWFEQRCQVLRARITRLLDLPGPVHPIAFVLLSGSLIYVCWIALVEYHAQPHIYDASAYLFQAKMYASGHFTVPVPEAGDRFPAPFTVEQDGQRFTQYGPGTAIMLAIGVLLGVPWLIEPLLGTLALLGIGLIASRLFDRRIGTLAIALGAVSPFYSYLAASYMSHAVALFFLVWGFWLLLRFFDGGARWLLPLAAVSFGMAWLTRDMVSLLFTLIALVGSLFLTVRRQLRVIETLAPGVRRNWRAQLAELWQEWRRWVFPGIVALAIAVVFWLIGLAINVTLTGEPFVSARNIFAPDDRLGFGMGVGFYGQHTLAAGLVILDQLLTSMATDLFGWPFYLTLVFLLMPFLTRRVVAADWFLLAGVVIMTGVFVGYFYHGIYLGPRFLFEALPFYLMLTARGIITVAEFGLDRARAVVAWLYRDEAMPIALPGVSFVTLGLVVGLLACAMLYYFPRQAAVYQNYSGLPAGRHVQTEVFNHPPVHHAIVVTANSQLYAYTLFALNDPLMRGDVLYALAGNEQEYQELEKAYPDRTLYCLDIASNGAVHFTPLTP